MRWTPHYKICDIAAVTLLGTFAETQRMEQQLQHHFVGKNWNSSYFKDITLPSKDLAELLELFGQEQRCYTLLIDLSRLQQTSLKNSDATSIEEIDRRKQLALEEVSRIERRIQPYKRAWPKLRNSLSAEDRQMLDLALGSVEELLAELIAEETKSEAIIGKMSPKTDAA